MPFTKGRIVAQKKILVIEDEEDCVTYVTAVLQNENTDVVSARDGVAGLKAAKSERPDLIILDVQMPKKDGFTVLIELKEDNVTKDIPVVMLTGITERTGVKFTASEIGSFIGVEPEGYVLKPIDAETLKSEVKRVLAS